MVCKGCPVSINAIKATAKLVSGAFFDLESKMAAGAPKVVVSYALQTVTSQHELLQSPKTFRVGGHPGVN